MDPFAKPPPLADTVKSSISQKDVEAALNIEEETLKKIRGDVSYEEINVIFIICLFSGLFHDCLGLEIWPILKMYTHIVSNSFLITSKTQIVRELRNVQYERVVFEKTLRRVEKNREILLKKLAQDGSPG